MRTCADRSGDTAKWRQHQRSVTLRSSDGRWRTNNSNLALILAIMKMTEADPADLCGAPAHGEKPPIKRGFASHSASFHIVRSRGVAVCTVYTLSVILTYSVYTVSSPRQYIHCLKYCETVYTLYTKRRTVYTLSQVLDSIYIVRMVYTLSQFTLGV